MSSRLGGRYHIVREIGSGGMGRVFQAVDTETGTAVAAKVLIAGDEIDLQALLRFQQEGAVLSTLTHPNIVRVFGTHLEGHTSSIIMELLEGHSLAHILATEQLPLVRIQHLMQQVAEALAYAHGRGIVHRDVKPDNIMVIGDDHVKVTDFGIARVLQEGGTLATHTGTAIGTPLYMSPEQIEGNRIDGRSDIYSFGAVLYQMVTGRPPFDGGDPLTVAFKHVHKAPDPPGAIRADIPEDWEDLTLRCLAKDPNDRPQTATGLAQAMAALTTVEQGARLRLVTPSEPASREVEAHEQEARTRLEQGKSKELTGESRSALRDYRAALTVAPPGPVREELQAAINRLTAKAESVPGTVVEERLAPASTATAVPTESRRTLPLRWLAIGGGIAAVAVIAIFVFVLTSGGSPSAAPTPGPTPRSNTGAFGGPFSRPGAVTVDSSGVVYVADTGNNRVEKLSSTGASLGQWGTAGSESGQFSGPKGIAVDGQGNIYVADSGNNRVQKLTATGEPVAQWGKSGSGSGEFRNPEGVAVDADGDIYVADTGNNRIQKLTSSGEFVTGWGAESSGTTAFNHPSGIEVDGQGNIYVADTGNSLVHKLSPQGKPLNEWGSPGTGAGQFNAPRGLVISGQGNIFVADTGNNRIQELAPTSDPVGLWIKGPAGRFHGPQGVGLGPHGVLYVVDTGNNRVQKTSTSAGTE